VAGASGFIGSRLTAALAEAGHRVRAMTRHPESYEGPGDPVQTDARRGASPSSRCCMVVFAGAARAHDIHGCAAFDVQAVCTGFVYALGIADKFFKAGSTKCALVIGAETLSRVVDWTDRNTCVLFGDGAGAVVLKASEDNTRGNK